MSEKTPLDIRLASCLPDLPNAGAIAALRAQEAGISQKRSYGQTGADDRTAITCVERTANLAAARRAAAPAPTRTLVYCRRLSVGEAVGLPGGDG